ncbi:MAG: hypothetical protein O2809_08510 [Proteobacteria bacterium]|nr:hypothetical protein [Pseudomonadota bacterium]
MENKKKSKTAQLHVCRSLHLKYKSYCAALGKSLQEVTEKLISTEIKESLVECDSSISSIKNQYIDHNNTMQGGGSSNG